jgi:hypothetical protein
LRGTKDYRRSPEANGSNQRIEKVTKQAFINFYFGVRRRLAKWPEVSNPAANTASAQSGIGTRVLGAAGPFTTSSPVV